MPLALVTGGGRRLGAVVSARLASMGYDIAIQSREGTPPEDGLIDRLAEVRHHVFAADLSDANAVSQLPEGVAQHFGGAIDLLVNGASMFAAFDGPQDCYRAVTEHCAVNLAAPVALASAVAAAAAGTDGAAIVNILDQRVVNPPVDQIAYTVSKQALAEATRTMAIALAPRARVNGVAPGLVLPTADYAEHQVERVGALMPLGRNATPDEVADAVAWLATARSVTGQTIFVDGGAHLRSFGRDFVHLER